MKSDFYFQANDIGFSFLDKILERAPEKQNTLIFEGSVFNNLISNREVLHQAIKLESIMLKQLEMNIGVFKIRCNNIVAINLLELTTEDDIDCLLRLSSKEISKIKTGNEKIQNIIDLVNLILIIKNPKKTAEPQVIPIKFSLDKGSFFINAIPIYRFPKKY